MLAPPRRYALPIVLGALALRCVSSPPPPPGDRLVGAVEGARSVEPAPQPADIDPPQEPVAAATEAEPDSGPEPDSRPEPDPEPKPATLDPRALSALLQGAHEALKAAGVHKSPAFRSHGRLPDDTLERAYAEGRAQAFRGRPAQVEQWMGIAKFGGEYDPSGKPTAPRRTNNGGPLARYDLTVVVESEDKAYLHVVVPPTGLADGVGDHRAYVRKQWWRCLGDRLEPGKDYHLFKTNHEASLHRQWAQEWVIDRVAELAAEYKASTGEAVGIGDLSLVVGGKISDHWTHRLGVDVDFYLLYPDGEHQADVLRHSWHTWKQGASIWSSDPEGRSDREGDDARRGHSSRLLDALARAALEQDDLHFFVHNAVDVLDDYDRRARERRPGRRYLHAENRAFWPEHRDHVHLRWTAKRRLPVDVPPRP